MRPVGQGGQAAVLVAAQPSVHRRPTVEAVGHLDHRDAVQNRQYRLIALFDHAELHQHSAHPFRLLRAGANRGGVQVSHITRSQRHPSAGTV